MRVSRQWQWQMRHMQMMLVHSCSGTALSLLCHSVAGLKMQDWCFSVPDAGASARDTLGQYPVVILTEKCAGEFGIHCTGVPSGFCLCVCVCVATTGKNMRTACSCTKWSQSTSYSAQCFLNAGSLAAPGKLSPSNPCCATCQGSCTAHLFSDLEMEVLQARGQNCFHAYCEILQPW